MFASPPVGSRAKNKIHNITMFILVAIDKDILEYYVQVRIIIQQTKDTNCDDAKRRII